MDDRIREITRILALATCSSEAVSRLFWLKKSRLKSRFSLQKIATAGGIASKGYLSQVMNGSRILNAKYLKAVSGSLGLNDIQTKYLGLLIIRDKKARKGEVTGEIDASLTKLRKVLSVDQFAADPEFLGDLFVVTLFCSFGLFANKPTLAQLCELFANSPRAQLRSSLDLLKKGGFIKNEGDRYHLLSDQVLFKGSGSMSQLNFLRQAIQAASVQVEPWIKRPGEAYFESSIISIKQAAYREVLDKFRLACAEAQSELESGEADRLLHFNVQIYPAVP